MNGLIPIRRGNFPRKISRSRKETVAKEQRIMRQESNVCLDAARAFPVMKRISNVT